MCFKFGVWTILIKNVVHFLNVYVFGELFESFECDSKSLLLFHRVFKKFIKIKMQKAAFFFNFNCLFQGLTLKGCANRIALNLNFTL